MTSLSELVRPRRQLWHSLSTELLTGLASGLLALVLQSPAVAQAPPGPDRYRRSTSARPKR